MFCGIDVSKNKSQVCIINADNGILKEFEISHTKAGFDELELNLTAETTIAMETTGNYSKAIYDYFNSKYKVIYVDNTQMHTFTKLHYTKLKNDKIDARLIARYLSFNLKKINPIRDNDLRDLSRLYYKTINQMSKYKHMFKNQINIIFPELETHFHLSKAKGITSLLLKYPTPQAIAQLSDEEISAALTKGYKRFAHLPNKFLQTIKQLASQSIGIKGYPTACFIQTIKILKFYEEIIDEIKAQIKISLKKSQYNELLNEFGYNYISLASIAGEVGDIRRFSNHKKFVSYCGMNISEKQSGKSLSKNCSITKRGNKILRHIFYMLVLTHLRYRKDGPIALFYKGLRLRGKHPKQCIVACARKLAIKCFFDLGRCH